MRILNTLLLLVCVTAHNKLVYSDQNADNAVDTALSSNTINDFDSVDNSNTANNKLYGGL